jgi:hypothetical protein
MPGYSVTYVKHFETALWSLQGLEWSLHKRLRCTPSTKIIVLKISMIFFFAYFHTVSFFFFMNTIAVNKILFCLGRCRETLYLCQKVLNRVSLSVTSGWSEGLELMLIVVCKYVLL